MLRDTEPGQAGHGAVQRQHENNEYVVVSRAESSVDLSVLSHDDVLAKIAADRGWKPSDQISRTFRWQAGEWCAAFGTDLSTPAKLTLGRGFEERLAAVADSIEDGAATRNASRNMVWCANEMKRVFDSITSSSGLPSQFADALTEILRQRNLSRVDLIDLLVSKCGENRNSARGFIYHYTGGSKSPRFPQSVRIVRSLERALDLAEDTLYSRAFRKPKVIAYAAADRLPYREWQAQRGKTEFRYGIPLPPQLTDIWEEICEWRSRGHIRVNGEVYAQTHPWRSVETRIKHEESVRRFLGFLTLPKASKSRAKMTLEEKWLAGKGMRVEDLSFGHLFDKELVWEYFDFLRDRQHNHSFTQDHLAYLIFLNSLVNSPSSYVKAHPGLAPLFGKPAMPREEWVAYVETLHQDMLRLARDIRRIVGSRPPRQRHPDDPMQGCFRDEDPMLLFWEMCDDMERHLPPKSYTEQHAVAWRDIAIFRMSFEVPLRCSNLIALQVGRDLLRESDGTWRVTIPKERLKNRYSDHAEPIDRAYSAETSKAMTRYYDEERKHLRHADRTKLFFLGGHTGPRRSPVEKLVKQGVDPEVAAYGLLPQSLYWAVARRTQVYFNISIGTNMFRHLLATSLLKDRPGDYEGAAAILNNSPKTVERNYAHLKQQDALRRADKWAIEKMRKHEVRRSMKGSRHGR